MSLKSAAAELALVQSPAILCGRISGFYVARVFVILPSDATDAFLDVLNPVSLSVHRIHPVLPNPFPRQIPKADVYVYRTLFRRTSQ